MFEREMDAILVLLLLYGIICGAVAFVFSGNPDHPSRFVRAIGNTATVSFAGIMAIAVLGGITCLVVSAMKTLLG